MKDPVCHMEVDKKTQFKTDFKGKVYFFCNASCQKEFELNPIKYIKF